MSRLSATYARIDPLELKPAPLPPEWILEGAPLARAVELGASPDGTCIAAQWDCTAGVFRWYFAVEEIVHILEGEVHIEDASGQQFTLRTGDVCVLPANTWMVWHVDRYVRKLANCRFPVPRPFGALVRIFQRLRNRVRMRWVGVPTSEPTPRAASVAPT